MTPLQSTNSPLKNDMVNIEYAYIGTLMSNPSMIGMYAVKPDHFQDNLCSKVCQQLDSGNTDPALICRELGNEVEPALVKMIGHVHTAGLEKHADAIIQAYARRKFAYALAIANRKISDGEGVDTTLNSLISAVDEDQESQFRTAAEGAYAVYDDIQQRTKGGCNVRAIPSGFSTIDRYTGGLERGSLITVAARPSMGKSALAASIALAVSQSHSACLSSLEMDSRSIAYRLIANISKMDLKLLRSSVGFSQTAWKASADAVDKISGLKLWIDDNPNRTASQISAQARRHHARYGLDLLMIDYIGLLGTDGHKSLPRHLQVAEMTRTFKALAKQLDCCVMILCQLNRDADGVRPSLAHLRESGAIEQDSDVVLFPYRYNENGTDKAVVIVAKNRNGPTGDAPIHWSASSASFENTGDA